MRMKASLLASTILTAEVDTLKQNLEQSEQELGMPRSSLRTRKVRNTLFKYIYKKVQLQKMTGLSWLLLGHV